MESAELKESLKWRQEDNEEVGPVRVLCPSSQKCCSATDPRLNLAQG